MLKILKKRLIKMILTIQSIKIIKQISKINKVYYENIKYKQSNIY